MSGSEGTGASGNVPGRDWVTVDRFEGEREEMAVLVVPDAGERGHHATVDVDRSRLPDGARAGDVIQLSEAVCPGEAEDLSHAVSRSLSGAAVDRQATRARREAIRSRIERLKDRGNETG